MVMRQPRAILSTSYCETLLAIFRTGWMEVLVQIRDHAFARIAVGPEECMIVTDGIQALTDVFLWKSFSLKALRKSFDGPFFAFDILLNVSPWSTLRVYFFRGNCDQIIPKQI